MSRKIDALVAEHVLGCDVRWMGSYPWCHCKDKNPLAPGRHLVQQQGGTQRLIEPSVRIRDAKLVLDEMRRFGDHGCGCAVEIETTVIEDGEIGWHVCFIERGVGNHRGEHLELETAICLAALAAKGIEV